VHNEAADNGSEQQSSSSSIIIIIWACQRRILHVRVTSSR